MKPTKQVLDLVHNGDLYRVTYTEKDRPSTVLIRVFTRGLNKGYELDFRDAPAYVQQVIREYV